MSGRQVGPAHEGNSRTMGMHAGEESDGCIVPGKPRTMPSNLGGGDGGGKAAGRGEGELQRMPRTQRRNQHVTEAASPRIGAAWAPNAPKADHVRPETGAGCGKAARPDLRGGRGAILVPTATSRVHSKDDTKADIRRQGSAIARTIFGLERSLRLSDTGTLRAIVSAGSSSSSYGVAAATQTSLED